MVYIIETVVSRFSSLLTVQMAALNLLKDSEVNLTRLTNHIIDSIKQSKTNLIKLNGAQRIPKNSDQIEFITNKTIAKIGNTSSYTIVIMPLRHLNSYTIG